MKKLPAFALFCTFSLLFSRAAWSQDFSSIDRDLEQLEGLINDTLQNIEEQQKLLEDLKQSLSESGNLIENYERIITERELLLLNLQAQLNAMSETYRKQSALLAKYERSSKFWKHFTLIGIPSAAAISGLIVWAAGK
jgi:septal ring factor EnvC (AmiA/AmiB activator)